MQPLTVRVAETRGPWLRAVRRRTRKVRREKKINGKSKEREGDRESTFHAYHPAEWKVLFRSTRWNISLQLLFLAALLRSAPTRASSRTTFLLPRKRNLVPGFSFASNFSPFLVRRVFLPELFPPSLLSRVSIFRFPFFSSNASSSFQFDPSAFYARSFPVSSVPGCNAIRKRIPRAFAVPT